MTKQLSPPRLEKGEVEDDVIYLKPRDAQPTDGDGTDPPFGVYFCTNCGNGTFLLKEEGIFCCICGYEVFYVED